MSKYGCILIGLLCLAGAASAMSSSHYVLNWNTTGGGGGGGSSSSYKIQGTVGLIAGYSSSTNYRLLGGFWGPVVSSPPTPVWTSPGGHTVSSIAMDAKSSAGQWFAVIRGTDNHIYFNNYTASTNSWSGWTSIGGTTNDEPAVAYTGNNYVHVVIRGTDNGLYSRKLNLTTNTWDSGWSSLGGHTSSAPTVISWSSAQIPGDPATLPYLWLAIRGTDNHLYVKRWIPATGWDSNWQSWGGTTNDRPAFALWYNTTSNSGVVTLGIRGADNKVYTRDYSFNSGGSGSLGSWIAPGGSTSSSPGIQYKDGILQIVVRGTDNHVYHKRGSNPYTALGGTTNDRPAVYNWPDQSSIEVSVRGTDTKIYDKVLNLTTNVWTGWTDMGHTAMGPPTFSRGTGSNGVLAIRGTDYGIYVRVV